MRETGSTVASADIPTQSANSTNTEAAPTENNAAANILFTIRYGGIKKSESDIHRTPT